MIRAYLRCSGCNQTWAETKETLTEIVDEVQKAGCPFWCLPMDNHIAVISHEEVEA